MKHFPYEGNMKFRPASRRRTHGGQEQLGRIHIFGYGFALTCSAAGTPGLGAAPEVTHGLDPHVGPGQHGAQPGQMDIDGVRAEYVGLVVPDVERRSATPG